jgi:hypothetical protein
VTSLFEYLRDSNPHGIPQADAIQLFLWIFCTKDFLPPELRALELSKAVLVDTFGQLSRDGRVTDGDSRDRPHPCWEDLVREFLLGNLTTDAEFPRRAERYFRSASEL